MKPISVVTVIGCMSSAALLWCALAAVAAPAPFKHRHKLTPSIVPKHPAPGVTTEFGSPLPGLVAADLADFLEGRDEFEAVETPEGGLGPIFNGSSCAGCHNAGSTGGASEQTVSRFGKLTGGAFDPLTRLGGSLLQSGAIDPAALERVPAEANVMARRLATPLFGAGLIEAIADADIELNATKPRPDGVRGRALKVLDAASGVWRVGRFGWKAQHATLLSFAGDAYVNEMGVTSRLFPVENAPNGRADLLARFDLVPDVEDAVNPETGKGDIDHAADFMRLLAPPQAVRATAASLAGERLFEQARCTACHVPVMYTGAHPAPALAHQPVRLYSDLLLHDMGRLGDRIEQDGAKGREMRTAPLWGLRARAPYLHDGRAATVREAIRQHDGEGAKARQRFEALKPIEQQQLLAFLQSI
jgi:CxxC motif-containing protein (DUF1111 family)